MIIDLHTQSWSSMSALGESAAAQLRRWRTEPWREIDTGPEAFDRAMQTVDGAVILGFESRLLDARITHDQVAQTLARDPRRYVGFAGIDPTQANVKQSLDRALELGLRGVTISPSLCGFHPCDTQAMVLYEMCEARQIPVHIQCTSSLSGMGRLEFDQPYLLDEAARSFANLKLVISSIGDPWVDQGLVLLSKHANVYADLAGLVQRPWQLYNAMVDAHQRDVMGQILFASGYPFRTPEQAIVALYSVNTVSQGSALPSVPREQLRAIVQRDALRCLGIEHHIASTASANRIGIAQDLERNAREEEQSMGIRTVTYPREATG